MSDHETTPLADPGPAFAAYFNVARHNLLLALNGVAEKTGLKSIDNDSDLLNHPVLQQLSTWARLENKDQPISDKDIRVVKRVVKGVQKALPILGDEFSQAISGQKISIEFNRNKTSPVAADASAERAHKPTEKSLRTWRIADLEWVLRMLTKTLMELRNFYSHAYQDHVHPKKELLNLLGTGFDAGRRDAKSRFEFLGHEVAHLMRSNPDTKREDPKALHALSRSERGALRFTLRGTAFFCCLFLEKQQAHEFLSQLPGFKHGQGRFHQATLRTYGHWSIRLPFVRIDTSSTAQSLALDMLNELARCPAEIYEHLSDEKQKEFETGADAADNWLSTEDGDTPDDDDTLRTRFIRHGDRFAPLMMDYLDQAARANTQHDTGLRFQLDMGDFYFAAYPKKLPDGSTDIRRLKQKVLRFGLLSQAQEQTPNKPDTWKNLERVNADRDFDQPYIVQTRAHYHRPQEGGSIAIQLAPQQTPLLYGEPQPNPAKPGQLRPLACERPDFWLSPYELVNLGFYQHLRIAHASQLREAQYPKVAHLFSTYRSSLKRLYENMQAQPDAWRCSNAQALDSKLQAFCKSADTSYYTLRSKDLPADLQALLLGQAKAPQAQMLQQAKNTLALLLDDGDARLRDVQRAKQTLVERIKPGKPAHRVLRAGEMATFLAKDMLRLQPVQDDSTAHKGKPTSIMADLLQARLAYFGRDKTSLPAVLNSLKLTGNAHAQQNHPFLQRIQVTAPGMNGIAQFYEAYLRERQAHLRTLNDQLLKDSITLKHPALAWLHLAEPPQRMQGKDSLSALLRTYLQRCASAEPLNLPRGLFKELVVKGLLSLDKPHLTQEIEQALAKERARGMPTSVSYLINQYFTHVQNDGYQEFYRYKRPKLDKRLQEASATAWQETQWAENTKKALYKEDQSTSGQDINDKLSAMWKDRARKLSHFDSNLAKQMRLRATQDQVLFLAAKHLIELNEAKDRRSPTHASPAQQANLLDTIKLHSLKREDLGALVPHQISTHDGKTIYADQIKAKNIHEFKRLARDRRLPGLLHYYEAERIAIGVVAHELQAYPRAQLQAFTDVLGFEKKHNQQQQLQASALQQGQSLHRTLLERHTQRSPLPKEQQTRLSAETLTLRNAFCHNQMPAPDNAKDPEAQTMLKQARESLASVRNEAADITHIKDGGSVAQHFAKALRERYSQLP